MRGTLLRKLLQAYAEGDSDAFEQAALQLASSEREAGHTKLADELRSIIARIGPRIEKQRKVVDIAAPREELSGLLEGGHCRERLSDIVISPSMKARLERVIEENRCRSELESWSVHPTRKLLFYGPPGCGKTLASKVLAGELGMPELTVRLEALFCKFLGATASHLRVIFDEMVQRPGVYLFDEFDALGKARGDDQDVGEMRRVVTSFLQLMDADKGHSLIIAATNSGEALDKALFRRFDLHLYFPLPTPEQITDLMKLRLAAFDLTEDTFRKCTGLATGMSFADVSRACNDAIKSMALAKRRKLKATDLLDSFRNLKDRLAS